jgi:osmotically inducible lipoprotein OsmB
MKSRRTIALIVVALCTSGCTGMSSTQQKSLSGGAIGAGGGALIGEVAGGHPAVGAVVGGAAGALTGYILGERGDSQHD